MNQREGSDSPESGLTSHPVMWPVKTRETCSHQVRVSLFIQQQDLFVCIWSVLLRFCKICILESCKMHTCSVGGAGGVHAIFGSFPMWNYHVSIKWGFLFAISDSTLSRWTETHPRCRGGIIPERFVWQGGGCNLTFSFSGELCF